MGLFSRHLRGGGLLPPRGRADPPPEPNPLALFDQWHREALARWDEAFARETGKTIDFTPCLARCETPHELWKRCLLETHQYVVRKPEFGRACLRYMTPTGPMFLDAGLAAIGRDDAEWAAAQQALETAPRRDLDPISAAINGSTELMELFGFDARPGQIIEVKSRDDLGFISRRAWQTNNTGPR